MKNPLIPLIHFLLILIAILSPILFDWRLILVVIILLWLEYFILGSCFLTQKQFGKEDKDMTFWFYMLRKLKINTNKRKLKIFVRYILPIIIIFLAIISQELFKNKPLIV
jgi:hypothetical protein